jgi:hypothetical protein
MYRLVFGADYAVGQPFAFASATTMAMAWSPSWLTEA